MSFRHQDLNSLGLLVWRSLRIVEAETASTSRRNSKFKEQQEELPLSEAQQKELDRRLENYQQNPANGSSWEEVKNRLGLVI